MMPKKIEKKSFEKHSCGLKNEVQCEDELEDENISLEDAEDDMFEEEE